MGWLGGEGSRHHAKDAPAVQGGGRALHQEALSPLRRRCSTPTAGLPERTERFRPSAWRGTRPSMSLVSRGGGGPPSRPPLRPNGGEGGCPPSGSQSAPLTASSPNPVPGAQPYPQTRPFHSSRAPQPARSWPSVSTLYFLPRRNTSPHSSTCRPRVTECSVEAWRDFKV